MKMKKYLYTIISSLLALSAQAQQWVWGEIAEEQSESEPLPTWLIVFVLIIGFFIYRYLCNKDAEEKEKRAEEKSIEEQQRLEEELDAYKAEHEDEEEQFFDDDIIEPSTSHFRPTTIMSNSAYSDSSCVKHEMSISKEIESSQEPIIQTETEFYSLSPDGKELVKGKDADIITIPEGIEKIKFEAFMGKKIKSVKFPKSLKHIEDLAFSGCSIEYIEIPATIDCFGAFVFSGCESLKKVKIEDGIKVFGVGMFSGCMCLEKVSLPQSLITIPNFAFEDCISLHNIKLPSCLKRIDDSAFCNCQILETLSIPQTVNDIGITAFRQCYALKEITIPYGVVGISDRAFYEAMDLGKVVLPEGLAYIMERAFYGCEHIHIKIPQSVVYIAPDAFAQCNDYSYDNLQIEVPTGKKSVLENLHTQLTGKVSEYSTSTHYVDSEDLARKRQLFIAILEDKRRRELEDLSTELGVSFRIDKQRTYSNF